MNIDFVVSLAVVAISGLILHFKSHVKFISLGLFVGLVLAETIATSVFGFVAARFSVLNTPATTTTIQLLLLLIPTIVLGVNHAVDKRRMGPLKTTAYVALATLFLMASVLSFLPDQWVQSIQTRSLIAFELVHFRIWLMVLVAILIIADSFHHKQVGGVKRKKKDKK